MRRIEKEMKIWSLPWGSPGDYSMIDCFLGDGFRGFVLPILEYCSEVWYFAANTRLKGTIPAENIFFYYRFLYAIMHRTTIVQNKILKDYLFLPFFCPANIYRPSLGMVQLALPKTTSAAQFLSQKKNNKPILLRIVCTTTY